MACAILHKIPICESSRVVLPVNAMPKADLRKPVETNVDRLRNLEKAGADATYCSPGTQFGRRLAFHALCQDQRANFSGQCEVTMHAMLTSYKFSSAAPPFWDEEKRLQGLAALKKVEDLTVLLTCASDGTVKVKRVNADGECVHCEPPQKFKVGEIIFTLYRRAVVVMMNPFVPVDAKNERSCYATLILHSPWGDDGEDGILGDCDTAVERLQSLSDNDELPEYVLPALGWLKQSHEGRDNAGDPNEDWENDEGDDAGGWNNDEARARIDDDEDNIFRDLEGRGDEHSEGEEDDTVEVVLTAERDVICLKSDSRINAYESFISDKKKEAQEKLAKENELSADEERRSRLGDQIPYPRKKELRKLFEDKVGVMNEGQREAIEVDLRYVEADIAEASTSKPSQKGGHHTPTHQLCHYSGGEAGTGKSFVIHALKVMCKVFYGKTGGMHGPVLVLTPTGSSAHPIGGYTWHSALKKTCDGALGSVELTDDVIQFLRRTLKSVRFVIIDEVSMISCEALHEISKRLQIGKGNDLPFGGLHVHFFGDFWQLPPVGYTPLYTDNDSLTGAALIGLNLWRDCVDNYTEFTENMRFQKSAVQFREFCSMARVGDVNNARFRELLAWINAKCFVRGASIHLDKGLARARQRVGPRAVVAASTHERVNQLNKVEHENLCEDGRQTFHLWAEHVPKSQTVVYPDEVERFRLLAQETKASGGQKSFKKMGPPMNRITGGTRISITDNLAGELGIFNGSMGTVYKVCYRKRLPKFYKPSRRQAARENEALPIILAEMDDTYTGPGIFDHMASRPKRVIPIVAVQSRTALKHKYIRKQYPFIVAACMTCHRIQGITAKHGCILDPSDVSSRDPFAHGVDYVGISRCTSETELALMSMLTTRHFASKRHEATRARVRAEYERLRRLK